MLVDTNVVSELVRPSPDARRATRDAKVLAWAKREARFHLSVITVEEILYGLAAKPNAAIEGWFSRFVERHCDVLPITVELADWCGRARGQLRREGKQRTQADMFIAATAFSHQLVLVTRNTRDFRGCGVRVMNPFA